MYIAKLLNWECQGTDKQGFDLVIHPDVSELRVLAQEYGLSLDSWDEENITNLSEIEGFWPGSINEEEAGFEFLCDEIDDEDLENWDIDRNQLSTQTAVITLDFHTELDLQASYVVAMLLCKNCNGLTFNDLDDELSVNQDNCNEWFKKQGY